MEQKMKSIVSWNIMMAVYVEHNEMERVLALLSMSSIYRMRVNDDDDTDSAQSASPMSSPTFNVGGDGNDGILIIITISLMSSLRCTPNAVTLSVAVW